MTEKANMRRWHRKPRVLFALATMSAIPVVYAFRESIADALHPGQRWDTSKFGLPITLEDGKTGVFTYSKRIYRLEGGGIMPFSGAQPNFFVDVKTIGAYDLQTGEIKILQKKRHKRHGDGRGDYHLHSAAGDSVLVIEEATKQVDYQSKGRCYLLTIPTNTFEELPLDQEHMENSVASDYRYLVKSDGTMVFTQGNPGGYGSAWVRLKDSTYVNLGTNVQYSGFRNDRVFFTQSVPQRASLCKAFEIQTRAVIDVNCQDFQELIRLREAQENKPAVLWWEADQKSLYVAKRAGTGSTKEPVQIPEYLLN